MQGMVLRPVQRCAAKGVAKGKANLDLARKAAQRTVSKKTLASAEGRCRGDRLARNGHCDKATRGGDLGARKEASRAGSGKGRNVRMGLTLHPAPVKRGQHWRLFSLDGAASESRGAWGGNGSNGGGRTGGGSGGRGGGNGSSGPSGKGPQGGESMGLFALYLALMDKHPLPSKIVTTGVLNFIGDLICQLAIEKQEFDANRSAIFTALGLVLVGPALHFWYLRLSKIVAGFGLKSNAAAVASLTLDQFTFAPIFIATFLSSLSLFEGNPANIVPRLQSDWFDSLKLNWKIWIPFQFLNFRFIPQNYQVLFANSVSVLWNIGLSFISHRKPAKAKEGAEEKSA